MSLQSTLVTMGAGGRLALTGDLSLRGITRPAVLVVSEVTNEQKDHNGVSSHRGDRNGEDVQLDARRRGVALADEVLLSVELSLMKTEALTERRQYHAPS